jgi:hypothetical protein
MCPSSAPSSITSYDMGGSRMGYFAFFVSWISGAPLTLGFKYPGVNVMGTPLHGSISGWSPLCHKDCLMDACPRNITVFSGVVITTTSPHVSNFFTISSRLVGSDIHLSCTMSLNSSQDYKIHESNRSMKIL